MSVAAAAKSAYWRTRFARWTSPRPNRPGYTLAVPVPGDLPVFLDLALTVCAAQSAEHRVETLVVPDVMTPGIRAAVDRARADWSGPLSLVDLPLPERKILPWLRDPGKNHGVQLITAVQRSSATHLVLHDADLFMLDDHLHDANFVLARDSDLDVVGVEGAWDPWYAAHGRELAATWEQTSRTAWLRSVAPSRHLGHDAELWGERHTFDTTFWAQCGTDPRRIAVTGASSSIVHFNYVISTYRKFQRSTGPFVDNQFRLLLIRLFVDLFDQGGHEYDVPTFAQLVSGLDEPLSRVVYRRSHADTYRSFRSKLQGMLSGPWIAPERLERAMQSLVAFDAFYDVGVVQRSN